MTRTASPRRRKSFRLSPRIKVWLEIDGRYAFGLGISEMLAAIAKTGSIKHAAAELNKSYRYVWGRVKAAERALGQPLVLTQVGGRGDQRSTLTPLARHYTDAFQALRARMKELLRVEFTRLFTAP